MIFNAKFLRLASMKLYFIGFPWRSDPSPKVLVLGQEELRRNF
jgi:hypothetical protein